MVDDACPGTDCIEVIAPGKKIVWSQVQRTGQQAPDIHLRGRAEDNAVGVDQEDLAVGVDAAEIWLGF